MDKREGGRTGRQRGREDEQRDLVLDVGLLGALQVHLDEAGGVEAHSHPLAHNLGREHEVLEQGVVHRRQGARPGPLLRLARLARRLGQHHPPREEHHVLAAELLLQLAHQPGLDLLVLLQQRHRHVHQDRLHRAKKTLQPDEKRKSTFSYLGRCTAETLCLRTKHLVDAAFRKKLE